MKTYRTRISIILLLIIAAIFLAPIFLYIREPKTGGLITIILTFALVLAIIFSCKYVIDGETLKVYYFFGIHKDIPIKSIKDITPSRNPISSPAASLKRIAIHYGDNDVILISPRNQDEFIEQINKIKNS